MFDTTNQYELSLVINGQPLTEYQHQGMVFVEGRTNSSYELRIKNNSNEKIMAILSVDGLSVIDGKPAGADSQGYLVDAWQTLTVPGWTVDGDTAAKFQFGSANGSYSNRTGRGKKNVGVIGMMVFRPKVKLVSPSVSINCIDHSFSPGYFNPTLTTDSVVPSGLRGYSICNSAMLGGSLESAPSFAATSMAKSANLGTEYGDATNFSTTTESFEKRDPNYPDAINCIYYDDANGLEARGIILPYRNTSPQAFPTYSNSTQYAPPPPGWKR